MSRRSREVIARLISLFKKNSIGTGHSLGFLIPPPIARRVIVGLGATSAFIFLVAQIATVAGFDDANEVLSQTEITRLTKERLKGIALALDSTREWLARDPMVRSALVSNNPSSLFRLLRERDSAYAARVRASALYGDPITNNVDREASSSGITATHGFAIYSWDGRLVSWCSSGTGGLGFDTTLKGNALLQSRDRGVMLDNGPVHVSLFAIQKLVSPGGNVEGYVESKRLLISKDPLSNGRTTGFVDDIRARAGREVTLVFGAVEEPRRVNSGLPQVDLYADPSDPASFVGRLSVSDAATPEPSLFSRVLHQVWTAGLSLATLVALLWLLISIAVRDGSNSISQAGGERTDDPNEQGVELEPGGSRRPLLTRTYYSILALIILISARMLLSSLGSIGSIVGQAYQDPSDFASDWGSGMVRNPLELFLTTVFATTAAVMLWIIWMPRKQLVRDDARKKDIREIVRRERTTLLVFTVVALLGSQFLVDGLSETVAAIVRNGSLRYLSVKQVLPAPGMLMMLLSFLGIGVTYFFLTALVLTFALRAAIFIIPRTVSLGIRIAAGAALIAIMMAAAGFGVQGLHLTDTSLLYRASLAAFIFSISLAVILIDTFSSDPTQTTPSFLYKLPRSSRTILFILAGSAVLMAPLVASKQFGTDKEIARTFVQDNTGVETPALETVASQVLNTASRRAVEWYSSGHDSIALRQTALISWLQGLREHQEWNAIVDIYDATGNILSHYSTSDAATEQARLRPTMDSVLRMIRRRDTITDAFFVEVPCFTSSCTPAVVGGILTNATPVLVSPTSVLPALPSAAAKPAFVTVALWTDLPALAAPRSRFNLLSGAAQSANAGPVLDGGFILAQYRPNLRRLTNTPTLDVPGSIPSAFERILRTRQYFWHEGVIDGAKYQTLYYRTNRSMQRDEKAAVLTVSIPEPTFGKITEFGLRMNAIGLIYGTCIVILLLLARQLGTSRLRFTLKFRDRIFLIVLLIALVPLVVVTNVTRTLLTARASSEQTARLTRDASVIKERISRQLEASVISSLALHSEVENLAEIIGREFSVYDATGRLRASSRPEFYESGMLPSILNASVIEEVVFGKRSFYTQPVQIGSQLYEAGYQPITSADGLRLLGVIALATRDEQSNVEAEIARTTSLIYGTFAALGLVLLGIGALFAARVASPILALMRATERVAQGKLSTSIPVTRQDEIGELMQSFNSMTRELEKSREIVAQTEREIAWKEMARQVAHEIKNPLTPMKLSVQHLEHAHEAKDPNFSSIFRRVIGTVSEQIDVLTRIATEFSRFGAMPRRKWGPVSLRKVADSAVALFDADRSRIRFIVDVPKNLPMLHSDEDELRRAFVNLLRNAVQAIEGWGIIVFRASLRQGMIHVSLSDTGSGMSEETLKRAFDPNFSTKTSGMGLGLAIVKKTITDMSGSIRVESRPGHGTTFLIDLPARGYVEEE